MIRGLAQRGGNYPKRGDTRRDGGSAGASAGIKDTCGRGRRCPTANKLSVTPSDKSLAEKYAAILALQHDATPSLLTKLSRGGKGGRSGGRREVTLSGIVKRMLRLLAPRSPGCVVGWLVGAGSYRSGMY